MDATNGRPIFEENSIKESFSLCVGTAITFLHDNEVFHFKKMLKSLSKGKISKHSIKDSDLECLVEAYETALAKLKTEVTFLKKQKKHR